MIITTLAALALLTGSVPPSSEPIPAGYVGLVDETDSIVIAAPTAWTEVDTTPAFNDDGSPRPYIAASADLTGFYALTASGLLYAALPYTATPTEVLDVYGIQEGCESFEVAEYEDPLFTGIIQIGSDCAEGMTWNMVVAAPADNSYTALVQVLSAEEIDRQTALRTFNTAE